MTLREQLLEMAEPGYRDFHASLLPGVGNIIGIRLPLLRGIAREIARGDWRAFLASDDILYYEERMLRGLVIGYAKCSPEEKLRHVARFVPQIDNWAVCDCFCWKLKAAEREPMWRFIQPYFRSEAEYGQRFAVVMALSNFVDAEHLEALLKHFETFRHEGYYARMGVAWAVSLCFIRFPERTMRWLAAECPLDDWTYNKSLQKIVESYRVTDTDKTAVRALKRRAK